MLIAQGFGEDSGVLQVDEGPLDLAQGPERTAQVEAEIDGLCLNVRTLWETLQRAQRLFEGRHRLVVC